MGDKTTTEQWEKMKAMRERRDGGGEKPSEGSPIEPIASSPAMPDKTRNADGTFAAAEKPDTPAVETPPETPPPAAAAVAVPVPPVAAAPTAPASVEVEIDGQKMLVDPSLAEALQKAEKIKVDATKLAERDELKRELREELKAELNPPKTAAELAAARAIADAEAEAKLPKKPDATLMVTDPDEFLKQAEAREEAKVKLERERTIAEIEARNRAAQDTVRKSEEVQAREILREQFYREYPVLRGSEKLVNAVLTAKFDEVIASGRVNEAVTPKQREDLKKTVFAEAAATATREVVGVMQHARRIAPPAEAVAPPPTVVASAPVTRDKPPRQALEKPREKYPSGSMSAQLARHKAAKDAASA